MRSFFLEYGCLCMLLFGVACNNEDVIIVPEQPQKLEIQLDAGSFRPVETRAGGVSPDVELKNVKARTISAGGGVLQDDISVTNLHWNGHNSYSGNLTVNDPSKVSKICFLANCFPGQVAAAEVDGNIRINFVPCTVSGLTVGIPMWGVAAWSKGTHLSAQLTRAVVAAKFVSKVKESTFQLNKIYLYNATDKVNVCSSDWTVNATQSEAAGTFQASGTGDSEFYFPEFKEINNKRTCFIMEATYKGNITFYRIDFFKNGEFFLPQRNSRYIFNILEVTQQGHATKEAALEGTGANVQKKILIDIEDNSNAVATDGTYRFSFGAVNSAVLDPKNFLITTFETDNSSEVSVSQIESEKSWLSNLRVEKKGSKIKEVENQDGTKSNITVYKWEIYGDFSNCDQLKTDSPIWGRRTQQVKLICGGFEKNIGVTQSLMPLIFVNYKEYVKGEGTKEIEVNSLEYDQMDWTIINKRYYRGLDLRPKSHKLRVWIKWEACSTGQSQASTELKLHIKVWKMQSDRRTYTTTETTKVATMDRSNNGMAYFDVDMPDVQNSDRECKNWIEVTASTKSSVDTKLYVEQRYIQDEDNSRMSYVFEN